MKKVLFTIAGLFFLFPAINAQKVGADKSLDASIKNYETFAWTSNIADIPEDEVFVGTDGVLVFNNKTSRSKIKDAVSYELKSKGYSMKYFNPDMLVNFYMTEQPGTLRTYDGYVVIQNGLDKVRTKENVKMVDTKAGTLIITIIDANSGVMVWQGFASGLLNADLMNSESSVMEAVASVFSKFDFTAKNYMPE